MLLLYSLNTIMRVMGMGLMQGIDLKSIDKAADMLTHWGGFGGWLLSS